MKKEALQIPENVVAFGQPEGEAVKLYIQQGIFKSLLTMPGSSILLGRYEQVGKETRLVISEYLEAEELSAETWEETKAAVAEAYQDLEILGWHYGNYDGAEELPEAVSALQSEIFNLQHLLHIM